MPFDILVTLAYIYTVLLIYIGAGIIGWCIVMAIQWIEKKLS